MGNMPSRWYGRAAALLAAILAAAGAWVLGSLAASRLAHGFTFDWYVHAPRARVPVDEALLAVGVAGGAAAVLAAGLLAWPTSLLTRLVARRVGYAPPRLARAAGLDLHAARLALGLALAGPILALLAFVYFSYPVDAAGGFSVGPAYGSLRPSGYVDLVASAAAAGAFVGALVAVWTVHAGVVDGRIAERGDRNLIARISLFGVRNARATVALVLAATAVAGYYASTLTTNVDVADVLPRGDPNTDAAHNLTEKFKSSFTQAVTFQFRVLNVSNETQLRLYQDENARKLPHRPDVEDLAAHDADNITDELYVRAMAEAIDFVVSQPPFVGSIAASDLFKLINWTMEGGSNRTANPDGEGFELPPTDEAGELRYRSVHEGVFRVGSVYAAVDAVVSPDWRQTAVLVTVDPKSEASSKLIGERALAVRDAWVEKVRRGETQFSVFGPDNPPQFTVDLPIANAHASALTAHDFKLLMPLIALFIAITLFIAFRNVTSVVVTFSSLAIAVTWTFGVMGWLEIPLNTINLAVVPLIMGVGIDYGIHMMNEFQEYRAKGRTPEEAWTLAGGGSALALFVGALTTAAGLCVMIVSPSLLVAQLGILGNVALASCYVLSVLFIPALVTLLGGNDRKARRVEYAPSRVMPALATAVSRGRILVVVLLLLLAGAAYASAQGLRREAFGDPPRNWLEDDPLRVEHENALKGFYASPDPDVKANILIIEGDLTDPAVHRYITRLTSTLRGNAENGTYLRDDGARVESRVIADTLKDLPFLLNTYLTCRDGIPGAGSFLGGGAIEQLFRDRGMEDVADVADASTAQYPRSKAEMRALLDDLFRSPLYQFGNLFVDHPDYGMTVIVFSARAATYEDAEDVWFEVQSAINASAADKPAGVTTSYFGNTAINYLFVAKQVPWLAKMNAVAVALVVVIVLLFTRSLPAALLVGSVSFLTSTLWFGLLATPYVDIGLAINLTLPLIFISAMGSDYALHLAMRCRASGDTRETMASVGKGVLFSFVTTLGAFLIFTQISDYSGRRSIVGTVLAIATVFVVTLLVVPVFYPVRRGRDGRHGPRAVPVVETRRTTAPQPIVSAPAPGGEAPRGDP